MSHRKTLAEFLRNARVRASLSQKDVSLRLGYSTPQFVSNWERGVSSPPCKTLRELAELYRVSAEELYEALVDDTLRRVERDMREEFYGASDSPPKNESRIRRARGRPAARARRA